MSRVWKDRVEEATSSVGTANFILTGATDNFQPFSIIGNGNECDYCVVTGSIVDGEMAGTAWEVGSGTYNSGANVLSRDTVYDGSSGAGVKISLTGESFVFLTIAALRMTAAGASAAGSTGDIQVNSSGSFAGLTPGSGVSTFLATPSSANLRAALTDEVGTGAAYFVGGALGTPASGTATNLTSIPVAQATGVLPAANGGAGTVSGVLRANGSGTVSAAAAGTDYAAAPSGSANTPLFNDGSGGFTNGTRSGNTTAVATVTGSLTNGHVAAFDASGNIVDGGAPSSGTGDVSGGSTSTDGELVSYNGTGGKTIKESFAKLSGPASTVKTYTLPNASATILTDAAAVTVAQGGTNATSASGTALDNITGFSSTGILARTGSGTYAQRTITGTASRISLTNGDGVSGNPTIDIDAAYVGQSSITTLGTIGTGTWAGTTVAVNHGGTGQTSYTDGQLLIGNTSGNTLTKATLTAGTGITVTNGNGSISIASTVTGSTGANPTATAGDVAVNGSASTFMRSDGAPAVQKGSSSAFGIVKVDNSTITASGGVLSVPAGPGGGAPSAVQVDSYTTSSGSPFTWSKPSGAKSITVICFGAGGGGGGGVGGNASSVRGAGAGGGGGAWNSRTFRSADIGGSETVTVGAGGTLGTAGSGGLGSSGGDGGSSSFGSWLFAGGGGGGPRGLTVGATSGGSGGGTAGNGLTGASGGVAGGLPGQSSTAVGVAGAGGGAPNTGAGKQAEYGGGGGGHVPNSGGAGTAGGDSISGGGGGGSGGGITSGNIGTGGAAGGGIGYTTGSGGGGGSGGGTNHGTGGTPGSSGKAGTGGGGGGSNTGGTAGHGGDGAAPSGGAGGGGGGTTAGGAGGTGGDGAVYVITYF